MLLDKAARREQDVSLVASELLASVLEWEKQNSEEAIKVIQQGLDDFDSGQFRPFQDFAEEQRSKYSLPANS